jgi:hypothetical protein
MQYMIHPIEILSVSHSFFNKTRELAPRIPSFSLTCVAACVKLLKHFPAK